MASCRICYEENGSEGSDLISPCRCRGTQEYIHRDCLDRWRKAKEGFAFTHCSTCKAQFKLQVNKVYDGIFTIVKHRLIGLMDVFVDFLIVQIVVLFCGGYVYLLDYEGIVWNAFYDRFNMFPKNPFSFYYIVGALFVFFFIGFSVIIPYWICLSTTNQRISNIQKFGFPLFMMNWYTASTVIITIAIAFVLFGIVHVLLAAQRGWHIRNELLARRNLTKVYVVVDQPGHYTPPQLDTIHEERLRALNLF